MKGMKFNPRDMERMMRQLGIKNEEIEDVKEVIINTKDKIIKIIPTSVQKINVQGQQTLQIIINSMEEEDKEIKKYTEEDIKIIMEKKGINEKEAIELLEKAQGDIVKALME